MSASGLVSSIVDYIAPLHVARVALVQSSIASHQHALGISPPTKARSNSRLFEYMCSLDQYISHHSSDEYSNRNSFARLVKHIFRNHGQIPSLPLQPSNLDKDIFHGLEKLYLTEFQSSVDQLCSLLSCSWALSVNLHASSLASVIAPSTGVQNQQSIKIAAVNVQKFISEMTSSIPASGSAIIFEFVDEILLLHAKFLAQICVPTILKLIQNPFSRFQDHDTLLFIVDTVKDLSAIWNHNLPDAFGNEHFFSVFNATEIWLERIGANVLHQVDVEGLLNEICFDEDQDVSAVYTLRRALLTPVKSLLNTLFHDIPTAACILCKEICSSSPHMPSRSNSATFAASIAFAKANFSRVQSLIQSGQALPRGVLQAAVEKCLFRAMSCMPMIAHSKISINMDHVYNSRLEAFTNLRNKQTTQALPVSSLRKALRENVFFRDRMQKDSTHSSPGSPSYEKFVDGVLHKESPTSGDEWSTLANSSQTQRPSFIVETAGTFRERIIRLQQEKHVLEDELKVQRTMFEVMKQRFETSLQAQNAADQLHLSQERQPTWPLPPGHYDMDVNPAPQSPNPMYPPGSSPSIPSEPNKESMGSGASVNTRSGEGRSKMNESSDLDKRKRRQTSRPKPPSMGTIAENYGTELQQQDRETGQVMDFATQVDELLAASARNNPNSISLHDEEQGNMKRQIARTSTALTSQDPETQERQLSRTSKALVNRDGAFGDGQLARTSKALVNRSGDGANDKQLTRTSKALVSRDGAVGDRQLARTSKALVNRSGDGANDKQLARTSKALVNRSMNIGDNVQMVPTSKALVNQSAVETQLARTSDALVTQDADDEQKKLARTSKALSTTSESLVNQPSPVDANGRQVARTSSELVKTESKADGSHQWIATKAELKARRQYERRNSPASISRKHTETLGQMRPKYHKPFVQMSTSHNPRTRRSKRQISIVELPFDVDDI